MQDNPQVLDVIAAVDNVLEGRWSQARLGTWAHQALLNDVARAVPIAERDRAVIEETLEQLMSLTERSQFMLKTSDLAAIAEQLGRTQSP